MAVSSSESDDLTRELRELRERRARHAKLARARHAANAANAERAPLLERAGDAPRGRRRREREYEYAAVADAARLPRRATGAATESDGEDDDLDDAWGRRPI